MQPMQPIPLIRAAGAVAFAASIAEVGVDVDRMWARAGIPPAKLLEPESLIPLRTLVAFAEEAARASQVPDLGLLAGERTDLEGIGAFGVAARSAPTLRKALETAIALVAHYDSGERLWMVREDDRIRLCRRARLPELGFRQADLFTLGLMTQLVRLVAGSDWRPERIELQSAGPVAFRPGTMLADSFVTTDRPVTSIVFPRAFLFRPLPTPAIELGTARMANGLPADPAMTELLASVRAVVELLLEPRRSDVATVSRTAGVSARSFQRKLAEAGVSYSELVDEVRLAVATRLLRDEGTKIIDVALAVGYSDPAHFTRAFRRWTAVSPKEYRRGMLLREQGSPASA